MAPSTNGTTPIARDYSAILADGYDTVKLPNGKSYRVIPLSAKTQKIMEQLQADQTEMYPRVAALCLEPEETAEYMISLPTVVSMDITNIATRGIKALMKMMSEDAKADAGKDDGAELSTPQPTST